MKISHIWFCFLFLVVVNAQEAFDLKEVILKNESLDKIKAELENCSDAALAEGLRVAVKKEKFEILELLIDFHGGLSETYVEEYSLFHFAHKENRKVTIWLMENFAFGNELMIAVCKGDIVEVKKLLKNKGLLLNNAGGDNKTALMLSPSAEITKILIDAGADTDHLDDNSFYAFDYAVIANRIDQAKILFRLLNQEGKNEAFRYATTKEMVQMFLAGGAKVAPEEEHSAFYHPMLENNLQGIDALIAAGVEINTIDSDGDNCLLYIDSAYLAEELLKRGAKIDLETRNESVMSFLLRNEYQELITFFGKKGISGWNDLMVASYSNDVYVVNEIIAKGTTEIDKTNDDGNTALVIACSQTASSVIKVLLDAGADPNTPGNKGALHCVIENVDKDGLEMLISAGLDIRKTDEGSNTDVITYLDEIQDGFEKELFDLEDDDEYCSELKWNIKTVKEMKDLLFSKGIRGWTKTMFAAYKGDLKTLKVVSQTQDVNKKNSQSDTALMLAKNVKVVDLLLKSGAKTEVLDRGHNTALSIAVARGDVAITKLLISKGANIHHQNANWDNILEIAIKNRRYKIAEDLIKRNIRGWNPLMAYAYAGNIAKVEECLKAGADIHHRSKDGETAILVCVKNTWNKNIFETLVKHGANINDQDDAQYNILMHAVYYLDIEAIEYIVETSISLHERNAYDEHAIEIAINNSCSEDIIKLLLRKKICGWTPLMAAVYAADTDQVQNAIENGADLEAKNDREDNALFMCLGPEHWYPNIFDILIEAGASTTSKDLLKSTILHHAVFLKNLDAIEHMLNQDLNIEVQGLVGFTPLFLAISQGSHKITKLLLANGAKINVYDKYKRTPLTFYLNQDDCELQFVKDLVTAGADINAIDGFESGSSLKVATARKHIEIVKFLLEKKAKGKNKALIAAASAGSRECLSLLLNAGADINNQVDSRKRTALIEAIYSSGNIGSITKFLVDKGADLNMQDEEGMTALMHAVDAKQYSSVEILVNAGADSSLLNMFGHTVFDLAKDDKRMISILGK